MYRKKKKIKIIKTLLILGPFSWNKKLDPEIKVSCGSYELLVSNVAHQMVEKFMIQNKFSSLLGEILLKFEICSFFSGYFGEKL